MLFLSFICFVVLVAIAASPAAQARQQRIANERKLKKLRDLGEAARRKNTERAVRRSVVEIKRIIDAEIYRRRSHITPNTMSLYRNMTSECRRTNNADRLVRLFESIADQSTAETEGALRRFFASTSR